MKKYSNVVKLLSLFSWALPIIGLGDDFLDMTRPLTETVAIRIKDRGLLFTMKDTELRRNQLYNWADEVGISHSGIVIKN